MNTLWGKNFLLEEILQICNAALNCYTSLPPSCRWDDFYRNIVSFVLKNETRNTRGRTRRCAQVSFFFFVKSWLTSFQDSTNSKISLIIILHTIKSPFAINLTDIGLPLDIVGFSLSNYFNFFWEGTKSVNATKGS